MDEEKVGPREVGDRAGQKERERARGGVSAVRAGAAGRGQKADGRFGAIAGS